MGNRRCSVRIVVTPLPVISTSASPLEVVELLAQFVHLLLGQLMIVLGLLQRLHHAFHIAQNRFERMPNAIDLPAQNTVGPTIPIVTIISPIPPITPFGTLRTLGPLRTAIRLARPFPAAISIRPAPNRAIGFNRLPFFTMFFAKIVPGCFRPPFTFRQRIGRLNRLVPFRPVVIRARRALFAVIIRLARLRSLLRIF